MNERKQICHLDLEEEAEEENTAEEEVEEEGGIYKLGRFVVQKIASAQTAGLLSPIRSVPLVFRSPVPTVTL